MPPLLALFAMLVLGLGFARGQDTKANPASPPPLAAERIPVILDTDINGDFDDTWALAMVLKSPRLDLKLVTTTAFNAVDRARLAAKLLTVAGRTDVPIGLGDPKVTCEAGCAGSQDAWLGDYKLTDYPGKVEQDGVQALIDTVNASPGPVTIIEIGPMFTLGAALKKDPGIAAKVNLVAMCGNFGWSDPEGRVHAEFNIQNAIPEAQLVFTSPWKSMAITPIDTCAGWIPPLWFQGFATSNDPLIQATMGATEAAAKRILKRTLPPGSPALAKTFHDPDGTADWKMIQLFDTVAVYLADPQNRDLLTLVKLKVHVTNDGHTVFSQNGKEIEVALTWKDKAALTGLSDDYLAYLKKILSTSTP